MVKNKQSGLIGCVDAPDIEEEDDMPRKNSAKR